MNYLAKFKLQARVRAFIVLILIIAVTIVTWIICSDIAGLSITFTLSLTAATAAILSVLASFALVEMFSEPLSAIEQTISYVAHDSRNTPAPDMTSLHLGREMVAAQSQQIFDIASGIHGAKTASNSDQGSAQSDSMSSINIFDNIYLPILGLDRAGKVSIINNNGAQYLKLEKNEIIGKDLNELARFEFRNENTLENWINSVKSNSVVDTKTWKNIRHTDNNQELKVFDLVASYSSENSSGTDTILTLFDRTDQHNTESQEISYVALAVHELRTPLTIMRGYIEVFEDEIAPTLSAEYTDFMHKMHASAQQLTAFVSNILNVAKIEEDQLSLKLRKENVTEILSSAVSDLELRAKVHNKHIELTVADNLPVVAVDRISLHEVINNLVDNAIKYGSQSDKIEISAAINQDNLVEVSVTDHGVGIPASVMDGLFQKFHRSHKTKSNVGGTGLGLYLCKALVKAMGGNIWVRSKEGQGATFSFTLVPYDQLKDKQTETEDGIIRGAHGWIKNHSLYRN